MYHPNLFRSPMHGLIAALLILALLAPLGEALQAQDLVWAKRAGGSSSSAGGYGIALDGTGNSYMTGYFQGSVTFGPGEANATILTTAGYSDIFVAKYDVNGTLVWAKRAGGSSSDVGLGIAVDGANNIYVTGTFDVSATFGLGEINQTTLSGFSGEIFVAKYDDDGVLLWAKRAGGSFFDVSNDIAVDGAGNSYITGQYRNSATFGSGDANETILFGTDRDIFVAKYNASGTLEWAKRAGGSSSNDFGFGIAVDGTGNSYVTGAFDGAATFAPGETNQTTLFGTNLEIFVTKYNATGVLMWAKRAGGSSYDWGRGITVDVAGNSYVTGKFEDSAIFGPGEANETTLSGADTALFVAKYDGNGALVWAKGAGGSNLKEGLGIAIDGAGNSYVTGHFLGSAIFGPGEANETTLTSAGYWDIFVAKHNGSGALLWAKRAGGTYDDQGFGIAVDGTGNSYVTGHFYGSATFGSGEANETTLTSVGYSEIFVAKFRSVTASPTADAGADQTVITVTGSAQITLNGSGSSDPDGDPLTYAWEITSKPAGSNATLSNLSIVNPTFVADVTGEYRVLLVVNDGTVNSAPDEVVITVITAQDAVQNLIDQVQELIAAGTLNEGQGNALITKLRVAIQQLDKGPAIQLLQAFIDQVNDFMSSTPPILTAAEGQPLIDAANAIIAALSTTPKAAQVNSGSSDLMTTTEGALPTGYHLEQNSPNPFNPTTTIQFSVPRESYVRLKVYNSFGAEVATLVDQQVAAGTYKVNWDASRLASGFYLYRLEAEGFAQTKKLLLMK